MSDTDNDGLNLDDPDRLPWLETADGYEYDDGASPLKVAGLVLGGLALLALIVLGIYYMQRNQTGAEGGNGEWDDIRDFRAADFVTDTEAAEANTAEYNLDAGTLVLSGRPVTQTPSICALTT